jgi:hypothetical protein
MHQRQRGRVTAIADGRYARVGPIERRRTDSSAARDYVKHKKTERHVSAAYPFSADFTSATSLLGLSDVIIRENRLVLRGVY